MKLSFLECYQILDITDDCDWPALRKKYKTLIQKSHPDRFPVGSPEQQAAENLIRTYNGAYKQIADFYQINKSLPPRVPKQTEEINRPHKPRKKRPSVNHEYTKEKNKTRSKAPLKFVLASAFIAGGYLINLYFNDNSSDQKDLSTSTRAPTLSTHILQNQINIQNTVTATPPAEEKYFSTGSGLGEVITTQGQPTRVEGNIWYYGESSVTFTDGVVSSWFRHPQSPLKVKITDSPGFQYRPRIGTEQKPENTHQPYWKR